MKSAFEKLKAHISVRWSKAPQFIFCDNYTDKCQQQVANLKTKIIYIDNESKFNSINIKEEILFQEFSSFTKILHEASI